MIFHKLKLARGNVHYVSNMLTRHFFTELDEMLDDNKTNGVGFRFIIKNERFR